MIATPYIRRLTVTALIGCAILIGWSSAALARPIDDPALNTNGSASHAPEPQRRSTGGQSHVTLPILLGGALALIVIGAGGYASHARTGRRVTA
jgi:hypothetical protein